jgi:tetratricopeptide (TPR) repeat protein
MKLQFAQLKEGSSWLIALIRGPQDRFLAEAPRGWERSSTIFNGLQRRRFHNGEARLRNLARRKPYLVYRLGQLKIARMTSAWLFLLVSQAYAAAGLQGSATQLGEVEKLVSERKYAEAEESVRKLINRQPSADAFHMLGYVCEQRGKLDEAEGAYTRALELNPGRPSSKVKLGIVHGKKKRYPECIATLETLDDARNDPEALFYLCQAYLEIGKQVKAIQTAKLVERWEEKDPSALLSVGRLLASKNLNEEAVPILKKAIGGLPESSEAYYSLAYALLKTRKLEEASLYVDKAQNLDPTSARILLLQALVLLDDRKLSQAKDSIRKAQALKPDDKFTAYLWSRALIEEGAYAEGITLLNDLIAGGYNDPNAHLSLITAFRRNGEFQKALNHALKMVEMFPSNPSAHLRAGIELDFLGEYQQADKYLRDAVALAGDDPEILTVAKFNLATIAAKEGKNADAVRLLEDVISTNPKDVLARVELADIYHRAGKYQDAAGVLRQALSYDSRNKRAHFLLGSVLTKLGNLSEAEDHFKIFQELEKSEGMPEPTQPSVYTQGTN